MNSGMMNDVCGCCRAIEECYEFMLAYATSIVRLERPWGPTRRPCSPLPISCSR
jgi:hypothetical protein